MTRPNGAHDMHKPFEFTAIVEAISRISVDNWMPEGIAVSSKGWKLLKRIIQIDSSFIPHTEADIWDRAGKMGL